MPMNDGLNIVREPGAELKCRLLSMKLLYFQIAKKYAYKRVQQCLYIEGKLYKEGWTSQKLQRTQGTSTHSGCMVQITDVTN